MSGMQILVCNAPYTRKGTTYRLYNVPKYRTYLRVRGCQYHINRRKSHEYIQCGGRIPTILLCPLYQLMLRKIHTMKEIPKYTQSEGGKWSGSDEHEQQQR